MLGFPLSPINGQTYTTSLGTNYVYDSSRTAWLINSSSGSQGLTGMPGITGSNGIQGITGNSGLTGTNGLTGSVGVVGITGSNGLTGLIGITGLNGINGITGSVGIQGITGPNGLTGIKGITGSNGIQGVTGSNGITGTTSGATGLPGSTGPQGITGLQGTPASPGNTAEGEIYATGGTLSVSGTPALVGSTVTWNNGQLNGFTTDLTNGELVCGSSALYGMQAEFDASGIASHDFLIAMYKNGNVITDHQASVRSPAGNGDFTVTIVGIDPLIPAIIYSYM